MARSPERSHLARNLIIGLAVVVLLYGLAGFLAVPWWLKRALPDRLEQQMGWQAEVGDINSNPFFLSLEALDLSARDSDNNKVAAFDRLYINLDFFDLIRGIMGFEAIELEAPFVRLDLLPDYSVNLARDFQAASARDHQQAAQPVEPGEEQAMPDVYFERLAISGGELLFRDFTQAQMAEFRFMPLHLTVDDLATWQRDDIRGDYHLQAAVGEQTIEWQGSVSVTPLYSSGNLMISGIDHATLGHFLAPYLPYDLRGGSATVRSDYELQSGGALYLSTRNGRLTVNDLAVAVAEGSEKASLKTASIAVDAVGFDLNTREIQIGPVVLEKPEIALTRNRAGEIDWLAEFDAFSRDGGQKGAAQEGAEAPEPASAGRPFYWSLEGIEVSDGRLRWQDRQPEAPAELVLEQLSLSTGDISSEMEDPMSYQLQASLASGGRMSLNGQVTPEPFTLEAAVSGAGVQLTAFEPYLQQAANVKIAEGTLGLDGNLDLDRQQEPLTGTFSGTAEVAGLELQLPDSTEQLLSWQTLHLAPIEYNVHPARLEIGTVTLAQPVVNLERNANNTLNVERAMPQSAAGNASAQPAQESGESDPFIFRIGQLMIETGAVNYTDQTLDPAFTTSLDQLNGSVTGLSNVSPQQGRVSATGRLDGSASVELNGTIGTLGTEETSDLKLTLQDLSLPPLSPYIGRYLGYGVDSGKLALDLDYEITGSRVDASNRIVMDRLGLGQSVASEQAVDVPVKLGLALLRDSSGVIEVNLPINGNLDNPDFNVGQVMMNAFVNLLAKAATSPFSLLGSIAEFAGLNAEELGQVRFEPGKVKLAPKEAEKLTALADALRDREELLLNIRGGVSSSADGLALLRDELAANPDEELTEQSWQKAREAYLAGERSLASGALGNLARARGAAVQELLRDTHGVPAAQLFMLEPSRDARVSNDGNVVIDFTLDVR